MKQTSSKYIFYIALFILFAITRFNFISNSGGLYDIEFKTVAIASSTFPFGIIINSSIKDNFMPLYHLILHIPLMFSKNEIFLHIFNSAIAFINIVLLVKIGKKLLSRNFGIFLGVAFAINKFFLFYTNLISPHCLCFLIGTVLVNYLIDYLKKPGFKVSNKLAITNILFIFCDNLGFIYVMIELIFLYLISKKKIKLQKYFQKIFQITIFGIFIASPILITHYFSSIHMLIPNSIQSIGYNFNGLYLTLNEYISPYLSFSAPENQSKNILGMLYTLSLNPTIKNLNSLKIIITVVYSSILPLILLSILLVKTTLKNYIIRILFYISLFDFIVIMFGSIYEIIELNPVYIIQFFIIIIITFCYEIYKIKDNAIKYILIFCYLFIQIVNPNINTFNVNIEKKYAVNGCIDSFIKDYQLTNEDFIIMPYMGEYGKLYYKNLSFCNFSYSMLKKAGKDKIIKYLSNKKTKSINRSNLKFLLSDYLLEKNPNGFITKYFVDNCIDKTEPEDRIVLIVDKLNSKPISRKTILKYTNIENYNPHYRKIHFKRNEALNNDTKQLYDAVCSKVLYDFITLLSESFYIKDIVEYKKVDNEYYKIQSSNNVMNSLMSAESDYVFIIFQRPALKL